METVIAIFWWIVKNWKFTLPAALLIALLSVWGLYKWEKHNSAIYKDAAQINYQSVIDLEKHNQISDKDITKAIAAERDRHKKFDVIRQQITVAPASSDGPVPQIVNDALNSLRAMEGAK